MYLSCLGGHLDSKMRENPRRIGCKEVFEDILVFDYRQNHNILVTVGIFSLRILALFCDNNNHYWHHGNFLQVRKNCFHYSLGVTWFILAREQSLLIWKIRLIERLCWPLKMFVTDYEIKRAESSEGQSEVKVIFIWERVE